MRWPNLNFFLVQGITIGEIGPKFSGSLDPNDNGFLLLDHVRIPLNQMLMGLAKVWNEFMSCTCIMHVYSWIVLSILWNDLTIKWNNLAWNDLSMEQSDWIEATILVTKSLKQTLLLVNFPKTFYCRMNLPLVSDQLPQVSSFYTNTCVHFPFYNVDLCIAVVSVLQNMHWSTLGKERGLVEWEKKCKDWM